MGRNFDSHRDIFMKQTYVENRDFYLLNPVPHCHISIKKISKNPKRNIDVWNLGSVYCWGYIFDHDTSLLLVNNSKVNWLNCDKERSSFKPIDVLLV